MTTVMTRRRLLATTGAVATLACWPQASSILAQDTSAHIGDSEDAFAADLGQGEPWGDDITRYTSASGYAYLVHATDGIVDAIEIDYANLPAAGLVEEDAGIGQSRFVPDGATSGFAFSGGKMSMGSKYHLQLWGTDLIGGVLVIDEENSIGDGEEDLAPFKGAWVTLGSGDDSGVTPVGEDITLGSTIDAWKDAYGETFSPARGIAFRDESVSNLVLDVGADGFIEEIDIEWYEEADRLPVADAFSVVGAYLPEQVTQAGSFRIWPGDRTGRSMRVHIWATPSMHMRMYSIVEFEGDETDGTATRILMGIGTA